MKWIVLAAVLGLGLAVFWAIHRWGGLFFLWLERKLGKTP